MIRFITAKRLRELEYDSSITQDLTAEMRIKDLLIKALRQQVSELVNNAVSPSKWDIGAAERKRNAEELVADVQAGRTKITADFASFPQSTNIDKV